MSVNKNIDYNINLKNDFYTFCNGNWLKNEKIPEKYSRWGTFEEVFEKNQQKIKEIITNCVKENKNNCQQIHRLYSTGMDMKKRNQQNTDYINFLIDKINNIRLKQNIIEVIAIFHRYEIDCLFNIYVDADAKDSSINRLHFNHSVLGMPDKDYYLSNDFDAYRIKYLKYIKQLLYSFKLDIVNKYPENIFNFEKKIAGITLSKEDKRDPIKCYHKLSLKQLINKFKNLYLTDYFRILNIDPEYVILDDINFYKKIEEFLNKFNIDEWKMYLLFCLMNSLAPYLSSVYDKIYFDFYGRSLSGQKKQKPLDEKITNTVNLYLEDSIGIIFVEKYFNKKSKKYVEEMIINFKKVLKGMISNLEWMDINTKKKAIHKLEYIKYKVGYPKRKVLKDLKNLDITEESYVKNILNCRKFDFDFDIKDLDQEINMDKWHMSPQTINAYYNPTYNEIVFPAAILQPPFFSINYTDAQNYGGIGCVIGHEITHAFDDQGCQFDYQGNLNNWWSKEDKIKFLKESKKMEKQYNNYVIINQKINGKLTLGENIADYGGVKISLKALIEKNPEIINERKKDINKINNFSDFTTIQKFFIFYSNIWKCLYTNQYLIQQIMSDPHSPNIFRVNGTLSIIDEFHENFDINKSDNLFVDKKKRCNIW